MKYFSLLVLVCVLTVGCKKTETRGIQLIVKCELCRVDYSIAGAARSVDVWQGTTLNVNGDVGDPIDITVCKLLQGNDTFWVDNTIDSIYRPDSFPSTAVVWMHNGEHLPFDQVGTGFDAMCASGSSEIPE